MTGPRICMIGVGNLMEVIWPVVGRNVGGDDAAERLIGVTADRADRARKAAHFGFEIVLDDNRSALDRNEPDIIMFAPPPSVAPELIESVLRPYYDERRSQGAALPDLYAFPPVPPGSAYLDALGPDALVVNIIPNNVTTIGGEAIEDEGYYVCTFPGPWPDDRVATLHSVFAGQGACIELEPHQLIPMLGGAATVSSLWSAVPAVADLVGADHRLVGRLMRRRRNPDLGGPEQPPPAVELLNAMIDGWWAGVGRYYAETDIEPAATRLLRERGFDLTLHTIEVEPRSVLDGHAVGAATKGGVLEHAIRSAGDVLLPEIAAALDQPVAEAWPAHFAGLVTEVCRSVRDHGHTLAG